MIIVILEKHCNGASGVIADKIRQERHLDYSNCFDFRDNLDRGHFSSKISKIRNDVIPKCNTPGGNKTDVRLRHALITTGDPMIVKILNFELLKNPGLHLEAYEALPAVKGKPWSMKNAMKNGLIDISIVEYAINKFEKDYAKLLKKRVGKK